MTTPPDKVEQALADKWYVVDVNGIVTLCADKADAEQVAADSTRCYPRNAPYIIARIMAAPATINDNEIDRKLIGGAKVAALEAEVARLAEERDHFKFNAERLARDKAFERERAETAEAALAEARRDAERLDYIERTFSGMTNRERYLPVQMIWSKGSNGRTLREACDKYMKRDAALHQRKENGHDG